MKKLKNMLGVFIPMIIALLFNSCDKENYELGEINLPSNLVIEAAIAGQDDTNPNGDGSGEVVITAKADDAISYYFVYNGDKIIVPSGEKEYLFTTLGTYTYKIDVYAVGAGGSTINSSIEFDVLASYEAPDEMLINIAGDANGDPTVTKTWRIKNEEAGHFGVGPADATEPIWYAAAADEKSETAMYHNRYVFNADGTFTNVTDFELEDGIVASIFGQADAITADFGADPTQEANGNNEFEYYPVASFDNSWVVTGPEGNEAIMLSGNSFFGFYTGSDSYTILSLTETEMILKTLDVNNNSWFFTLTTCEVGEVCGENPIDVEYTNLVWADEFDIDGSPDSANWNFNIGRGSGGWGNNELQYYTDRTDNAAVSGGTLKITAKKETYEGALYTSARMKTEGDFDFTYGRVDVRAKLPDGGGSWPAIWMLGSNFPTVGWPNCGEIDIMEHVGNNLNTVQSALHTPSSFGDTINKGSTVVDTATTEFHIYSVNWSADKIIFLVDDIIIYTYSPTVKTADNWPFDNDQFIILNVAMGGTLGGTIDPAFTETTMEVDYVRVYQ